VGAEELKPNPPRLVMDTNVVVSGLLFDGPPARLVDLGRQGHVRLVLSKSIVQEYLRVLAYPRFELSQTEIKALIEKAILPAAEIVDAAKAPAVIRKDPSDDKFLAAAVAAHAHAIISGDHHLLGLGSHRGIPIRTAADYLAELKAAAKRRFPVGG
jgi:putative PIN family toxin of toxin-antitoxin system